MVEENRHAERIKITRIKYNMVVVVQWAFLLVQVFALLFASFIGPPSILLPFIAVGAIASALIISICGPMRVSREFYVQAKGANENERRQLSNTNIDND